MKNYLLSTFAVLIFTIEVSIAKSNNGSICFQFAPKIGFTQNIDYDFGNGSTVPGLAFNAQLSYSHFIPKLSAFAEFGLGYLSFRHSIDEKPLQMPIEANSLSFQFAALQAMVRIGTVHKLQKLNATILPYIGIRYLFYLPDGKFDMSFKNVDPLLIHSYDCLYARYKLDLIHYPIHSFLLTFGAKLQYAMNDQLSINAAPFLDVGFQSLRTSIYQSEQAFKMNQDIFNSIISVNNGSAVGLEFGVSYHLRK
jgi:hypothetical protein